MEQDAVTKIQQRLAELPEDVRAAIQSSELHTTIATIGAKYQLHIDQVGELEDEVMLAMLGFAPLESLGARLSQALRLTSQVGEQLAGDINTQVFGSIRESMKQFAAQKVAAANPVPVVTQPAAATATPVPPITPTIPTPPAPAASPKPPIAPDLHKADVVLTEKTVSVPPTPPPSAATPTPDTAPVYKADPYREPI